MTTPPDDSVHAACEAAHAEGGSVCPHCAPLLHVATCSCETCAVWWTQDDAEE